MKQKKLILTPAQKIIIDKKIREHRALKEITELLKNVKSKKNGKK